MSLRPAFSYRCRICSLLPRFQASRGEESVEREFLWTLGSISSAFPLLSRVRLAMLRKAGPDPKNESSTFAKYSMQALPFWRARYSL